MSDSYVQSVTRAFSILELLREHPKGLGVSDIAEKLDLSTTTAHRLVNTLIACKVVEQNGDNRHYRLAPYLLLYSKAVLDRFDFISSSRPYLGELSKAVGETVFMGILDDFELVYVDHVDSLDHALRLTPQIGRRHSAHATALGKVLLANLPANMFEMYFSSTNQLPRLTDNTITDPVMLRQELALTRQRGYALDNEESETGICCIAMPVNNIEGQTVAAVSISGPATRIRKKGLETNLKDVLEAALAKISQLTIV
jgi:IclR family KDG regulon transcriptional repressor